VFPENTLKIKLPKLFFLIS